MWLAVVVACVLYEGEKVCEPVLRYETGTEQSCRRVEFHMTHDARRMLAYHGYVVTSTHFSCQAGGDEV
jgi:hypothetical protein